MVQATVKQFKHCSACRSACYCSEAHAAVHWKEGHRRACKELRAALGAQEGENKGEPRD